MKVLLVSQYFYPKIGGLETSLESISQAMKAVGIDVEILTSQFDKSLPIREERDDMIINRYVYVDNILTRAMPFIKVFLVRRGFKKYIKKHNYDLIISRDAISTYACSFYKKSKILYLPGSIVEHEYLYEKYQGILSYLYNVSKIQYIKLQKLAFEKSDLIMCYSENFKEEIEDYCTEMNISTVYVNHPGVNNKFKPISTINADQYRKYNINCQDVVFLYIGRLEPQKNVDLIIEAFGKIEYEDKKLLIVGTGADEPKLKKLTNELRLQDKIIFVGKSYEQQLFYNLADYMITASEYEPFGFVIIESLACGTPVIGVKREYPAIKVAFDEIVTDEKQGLVVRKCTVNSMSEILNKAIKLKNDAPNSYEKMCEEGLQLVQDSYNWEIFIQNLKQIYKESR